MADETPHAVPTDEKTRVFRAPGRVNLIGEYTDFNGGLVMPAALDLEARVTVIPLSGREIEVKSTDLGEGFSLNLEDENAAPNGTWTDYVQGVAVMLGRRGIRLRPSRLVIESNIPLGAGLSSSAALEVAVAHALLDRAGSVIAPAELARLCQQAENEFVGVRCGIMDQYASCCARAGHALVLNCLTMEARHYPIPPAVNLVICNTMVRHALASGAYNQRRAECEEAARLLGIAFLGELSVGDFAVRERGLPEPLGRRARHVVTENARVESAAMALEGNDLASFGRAMNESHASLRDDFGVSCGEVEAMVTAARAQPGVYGARMTGGGFGGCTINLVRTEVVERFIADVPAAYRAQTGITPEIYVCSAVAGAGEVIKRI